MKQIVVPTDFSAAAENAMLYAGPLAQKNNAGVLLLNVFQIPVTMSDVPVLMISADELKANADRGLQRAKETLQKLVPSVPVQTESRMGNVADEVNALCEEVKPLAVVTGSHNSSGLERFFFGSTSLSIVRHSQVPVIVIPQNATKKEASAIALAIDDQIESLPKEKIKDVVAALGAELHIIHVQNQHTETIEFGELVSGIDATCQTVYDDDFFHGIQTYLGKNNIDLLMVLPHRHSFVERLTFRTHTEELLQKLTIPVVCINED